MAARRRFLLVAAVLSIFGHLAAALLVVYLPRVLPREARPQEQGTVELLMVERKGADPSEAAPTQESQPTPPQPTKEAEAQKPDAQKPVTTAAASPPTPKPPVVEHGGEAMPPPTEESRSAAAKPDTKQEAQQPPAQPPAPPKAQAAPVFDLAGTESDSNADVLGGRVVPASPDDRFRNRPPVYPYEAAVQGQHGSVLLVIHVSDAGLATGVDVVESSGVASLDRAASTAVRKWRFRPALQEGRAIPFDIPFRFVFEAN